MKKTLKTLDHFFRFLLLTYPKPYREEYGFEVQGVFKQIISEAAHQNTLQLALVTLRELRDYPITLIREHWQNYTQKEFAMVTNTTARPANGCPRCGTNKEANARYCPNCGRAFIPFREFITEQSVNFFNAKLLLQIFTILSFVVLSIWGSDFVIYRRYHPTTMMILLIGVALFSFLAGWRLFSSSPNYKKLRSLIIITVIALVFFGLTSELDMTLLRNAVTADNPLSYQTLNLTTYVAYVEEKQEYYTNQHLTGHGFWMQKYFYFSPDEISRTTYSPFIPPGYPREKMTSADNQPALVIERSFASKDFHLLASFLFTTAFGSAGFFSAKKIAKRSLEENV